MGRIPAVSRNTYHMSIIDQCKNESLTNLVLFRTVMSISIASDENKNYSSTEPLSKTVSQQLLFGLGFD